MSTHREPPSDPDIEHLHLPRRVLPQPHLFLGVTAVLTSVITDSIVPAFELYINEVLKEILFCVWLFSHSVISMRFIPLRLEQQGALFQGMNLPLSNSIFWIPFYEYILVSILLGWAFGWFPVWSNYESHCYPCPCTVLINDSHDFCPAWCPHSNRLVVSYNHEWGLCDL